MGWRTFARSFAVTLVAVVPIWVGMLLVPLDISYVVGLVVGIWAGVWLAMDGVAPE